MAIDPFKNMFKHLERPADRFFNITPESDGGPALGTVTRAIYVGTGGNITLQSKAGDKVTINNVQDGSILPIRVYKVIDSDTTATDIIGLY